MARVPLDASARLLGTLRYSLVSQLMDRKKSACFIRLMDTTYSLTIFLQKPTNCTSAVCPEIRPRRALPDPQAHPPSRATASSASNVGTAGIGCVHRPQIMMETHLFTTHHIQSTNIGICHVRLLVLPKHGDGRVSLGGQDVDKGI